MDQMIGIGGDYIAIKALEDGVSIMGITRGRDTRFHHTEILDEGQVYIAQFTEITSAMKVRGRAMVYTKHGTILTGKEEDRD